MKKSVNLLWYAPVMVEYRRKTFGFRASFFAPRSFPETRKRTILRALKTAIEGTPLGRLRKQLGRNRVWDLSLSVIGPEAMRKVNLTYRRKNRPTDVLSFSHLETPAVPGSDRSLGEILLCWPVIRRQAKEFGVSESEELTRMTIHGWLHLLGYEHEQGGKAAREMFSLQEKLVIPRGSLRSGRASRLDKPDRSSP